MSTTAQIIRFPTRQSQVPAARISIGDAAAKVFERLLRIRLR
jgi:hypothetical protein